MGVEQDGLGCFETNCIFYEIKAVAGILCGMTKVAKWDSGGSKKGSPDSPASLWRFIAMKLHQSAGNQRAGCLDIRNAGVDKQQHGGDKRRKALRQRCSTFGSDVTRAGRVEHKTNCINSSGSDGINIFFACQSANLDAGAGAGLGYCGVGSGTVHALDYGNQSKAGARVGKP